jgi:hypothetical protein
MAVPVVEVACTTDVTVEVVDPPPAPPVPVVLPLSPQPSHRAPKERPTIPKSAVVRIGRAYR